jgi:hypothetical protein
VIVLIVAVVAFLLVLGVETLQFNTSIVHEGVTYQQAVTATGNASVEASPSVPAAKTGQLTTRTSTTVGTLTMDPGHGFTTAAIISLFWSGGSRRDVVVGTVSTNSVPFSGGTGDDLPTNNTAITAMVPTSVVFALTGDNCTGILAFEVPVPGDGDAYVELESSAPAVLKSYKVNPANPSGSWDGTGTNPLAGVTVATARFSHGAVAARSMGCTTLYN